MAVLEENPCIVKPAKLVGVDEPGRAPTPDKSDISVVNYQFGKTVSQIFNGEIYGSLTSRRVTRNGALKESSSSHRRSIALLRSAATCETPMGISIEVLARPREPSMECWRRSGPRMCPVGAAVWLGVTRVGSAAT